MDASPIGTIHSLCARILRTHPVEAALDPAFDVLDENRAAALQAQAVENGPGSGRPMTPMRPFSFRC